MKEDKTENLQDELALQKNVTIYMIGQWISIEVVLIYQSQLGLVATQHHVIMPNLTNELRSLGKSPQTCHCH